MSTNNDRIIELAEAVAEHRQIAKDLQAQRDNFDARILAAEELLRSAIERLKSEVSHKRLPEINLWQPLRFTLSDGGGVYIERVSELDGDPTGAIRVQSRYSLNWYKRDADGHWHRDE